MVQIINIDEQATGMVIANQTGNMSHIVLKKLIKLYMLSKNSNKS